MIKITRILLTVVSLLTTFSIVAQHSTSITARLDVETDSLYITQNILFTNTSDDTLSEIYLNDWAHSFSSKRTPLARRFSEEFEKKFHLAKDSERGSTNIKSLTISGQNVSFTRPEGHPDIIKIELTTPLSPGEKLNLFTRYSVKIPRSRYTRYGVTRNGEYNLRYWYLIPAVYDGEWQIYSNKNIDDIYVNPTDFDVKISVPKNFYLTSDLSFESRSSSFNSYEDFIFLKGEKSTAARLFIKNDETFFTTATDHYIVETNLRDEKVPNALEGLIIDRIGSFLDARLGEYPNKKIVVSQIDYKENPVYGLSSLPDFIQPFPDGFQHEIKLLKTIINKYVNQTILVNPRKDHWLIDGIKILLMEEYIDLYYPDLKVTGKLDRYWIARQFHISQVKFTSQFNLLYTHMARLNLDQALTTSKDSLTKFNQEITSPYKSGSGLRYLDDYLGNATVQRALKQFYKKYAGSLTSVQNFRPIVDSLVDVDTLSRKRTTDWFFTDYLNTKSKIDYTITRSRKKGDSIYVTLRNNRKNTVPIPLYTMNADTVTAKTWVNGFKGKKTIALKSTPVDQFILNKEYIVPENNRRNNYYTPKAFLGINKPFQFKFFQDIENPAKNQLFFMPVFEFNIYDGLSPGVKLYTKTLLRKRLNYKLEPQYGLRSKTIIGKASVSYTHYFEDTKLFSLRYGISGSRFSYADGLFFRKFTPFTSVSFRPLDLRSNKRTVISARYVSVERDDDPLAINQEVDYSVLNLRFSRSNPAIINSLNYNASFELGRDFTKLSGTLFFRRLFLNNRQLNLRVFAGAFLRNETLENGNFFSFALDRPTDYLFDYNYYGRSEDTGLFSQQYIQAEGGFKSQLEPEFANDWIATTNVSTTIWKYIYAYGDLGFVKNKGTSAQFLYDSGIQVSLLDDYFELYFPVYSNLGWEIAQPNYDQKIRFTVTIGFDTLVGLFTRRWY